MFVWVFHRISGVLLIFLLLFQLLTGFFQAGSADPDVVETARALHRLPVMNCVIVFLFIFHALYGVRTILMDLGLGREKLLFRFCSILGVVVFAAFLVLYATLVRP